MIYVYITLGLIAAYMLGLATPFAVLAYLDSRENG